MFCGKCGTQIEDNALFCPNCGEKTVNTDLSVQKRQKAEAKKFALPIGIVAGVVVIIVLVASLFGGGGYKKTLNNYCKAIENSDADLMYNAVVAQYWIDFYNEGFGGNSAYDMIQDNIKDKIDDWDCGKDIKITYDILNEKRATNEELEGLEKNIYDWYAYYVYDRDEFSITDAYVLDIEFTVEGNDGTESFNYPDGLLIIKENGEWRIAKGWISCSFYDNQ